MSKLNNKIKKINNSNELDVYFFLDYVNMLKPDDDMEYISETETVDIDEIEDEYNVELFLYQSYRYVYNLFKKEDLHPETLIEANDCLMSLLNLKTDGEINVDVKINGENKRVKINNNNFYLAFHCSVWKKLNFQQRAQLLYWRFKQEMNKLGFKDYKFTMIPDGFHHKDNVLMGCVLFNYKTLFINPLLLLRNNPFEVIVSLEHELQHINQQAYSLNKTYNKKERKNIFEYDLANYYCKSLNFECRFSSNSNIPLYVGKSVEAKADAKALKIVEKYYNACNDMFGKTVSQKKYFTMLKTDLMIRNYKLPIKQARKRFEQIYNNIEFEREDGGELPPNFARGEAESSLIRYKNEQAEYKNINYLYTLAYIKEKYKELAKQSNIEEQKQYFGEKRAFYQDLINQYSKNSFVSKLEENDLKETGLEEEVKLFE